MLIKQRALVDGTECEFAGEEIAPGQWRLTIDGKVFAIDLQEVAADSFSVLIGDRSWSFDVERDGEEFVVNTRCASLRIDLGLAGPKPAASAAAGRHLSGKAEVKAMMPGRVVSVLVKAGVEVEAGQGLVVIEAMKMENELKAPRAGRVKEIRVAAAETVEQGQVLVVLE